MDAWTCRPMQGLFFDGLGAWLGLPGSQRMVSFLYAQHDIVFFMIFLIYITWHNIFFHFNFFNKFYACIDLYCKLILINKFIK